MPSCSKRASVNARLLWHLRLPDKDWRPILATRQHIGRWVERDRSGEELLRFMIVAACKAVHVGEPAMVRLPCIERGRWHEQRPVAFDDVNFSIKTCDDPRGQWRRRGKGIFGVAAELVRSKDPTAIWLDEFD